MNVRDIRLHCSGEDWDAARGAVDPSSSPVAKTGIEWVRWKPERAPFPRFLVPKEGMYWHQQAADPLR